jgi:hypothetical protein
VGVGMFHGSKKVHFNLTRLGGFNFQFAWSSGTVAGRSAGRRAD